MVALGVAWFLLSRKERPAKLVYQWSGRVVVGKEKEELPADILAAMREANSLYVCCSEIVLWNAGKETVRGSDINPAEPIRISTPPSSKILRITTRSATNDAISCVLTQDPDRPNVVFCSFDFLAPGEGMRLQIYETGVVYGVNLTGRVRGQRDCILNWGRVPIGDDSNVRASWMVRHSPLICVLFVLLVILVIPAGLFVKKARHGQDPDFQLVTFGDGMRIASFALLSLSQVRTTMAQYRARIGRYPRNLADN